MFFDLAGQSSASMLVIVKPPPGKLPASSEESGKQNNQLDPGTFFHHTISMLFGNVAFFFHLFFVF